ncbi:interferon-related developmental regulator-domain-containing protein [Phyllosticta capitalensis]|uniref:Interferon-related developmental regulator-domain-containing protein n=1 Tax=Phyllosticta capitalensis TaxID=121624 RepID=A0ABR1YLQ8_9PEZI
MPDLDLRRQVLESGKTVSRKARAKQQSGATSKVSSAANSPAASRNASRAASRNVSDEEDGNFSDETSMSMNSIDDVVAAELESSPDAWKALLEDRMTEILDRKRSSTDGRADTLAAYCYLLKGHYAYDEIEHKAPELIPAIVKSLKLDSSDRETINALKAIEVTLITVPSDDLYDTVAGPMKRVIENAESSAVKVAAIHAYGVATFYGGASSEETEEVMDFYLSIAESDGYSIEAGDDGAVVTAALEEYGFLATLSDDLERSCETAMDVFVEQLNSSDLDVQVAAGEDIALMYEKALGDIHPEEKNVEDEVVDPDRSPGAPRYQKLYTVYRREGDLKHTLSALSGLSVGRVAHSDRKRMRSTFSDILNTIEFPGRGPRYNTAMSSSGRSYGSRMHIKIGQAGEMNIDKWWKLFRLKALRRALQGGFLTHYEKNEVVLDSLP